MVATRVRPGVELVCERPSLVGNTSRVAFMTNARVVMPDYASPVAALLNAGFEITALLTPEHGWTGGVQAGESEGDVTDPNTGIVALDTYGVTGTALDEVLRRADADTVLFDLPDVGSRFYTYISSLYDIMSSAARLGVRVVVLDRPNPLSGSVAEGALLEEAYASFVGRLPVPIRHGLTVGEIALLAQQTLGGDLKVVRAEGWSRDQYADDTGLPWVMPSVNLPTLDSALVYPGTCLFEGTNVSEGRGTTRPFELVGAPYVDDRWREAIEAARLPGVVVRDEWYTPTFHKHAGVKIRGVQVHVIDRGAFQPVLTGVTMLTLLADLYPECFTWRERNDEETAESGYFIDSLWGSSKLRETVEQGCADPARLCPSPAHPSAWLGDLAEPCLLYS